MIKYRKIGSFVIFLILVFCIPPIASFNLDLAQDSETAVYGWVYYADGVTPLDSAPVDSLMIEVVNDTGGVYGVYFTEPDLTGLYIVQDVTWTPEYNIVQVTYNDGMYLGFNFDVADNVGPGETRIDVVTNMPVPTTMVHGTVYYIDGVTPLDCAPLDSLTIEVWHPYHGMAPFGPYITQPNIYGEYNIMVHYTLFYNEIRVYYDDGTYLGFNSAVADNTGPGDTTIDVVTNVPLPITAVYGWVYYEDGVTPLENAPLNSLKIDVVDSFGAVLGTWFTQPDMTGLYIVQDVSWTLRYNIVNVTYNDEMYYGFNSGVADNQGPGETWIDVVINRPVPTTMVHGTIYYDDGVTPLDCAPPNSLTVEVWHPDAGMAPFGPYITQPDMDGEYNLMIHYTLFYDEVRVYYDDGIYTGVGIGVANNNGPGDTLIDVITNMPVPTLTIFKEVGQPNMTGSGGSPDWWVTSETPIAIDAEATGGEVTEVMHKINDGEWITIPLNELPKEIYFGGDCVHELSIKAVDSHSNVVYDNETFYVDNQVPGMVLEVFPPMGVHPSGAHLITDNSAISFTAMDQGVDPCIVGYICMYYRYWFNGTWTETYSMCNEQHGQVGCNIVDFIQGDGVHYFEWYSEDGLGNRYLLSGWWNTTFYVDNLPPDVVIDVGDPHGMLPGDDTTYVTNETPLWMNATDNDTYYPAVSESVHLYYKIWHNGSWSDIVHLHEDYGTVSELLKLEENGIYYIEYYTEDLLQNRNPLIGWSNVTFFVDIIPPSIDDHTPSEGNAGDPFTFNATVIDNINVSEVWVEYWFDAGEHSNETMVNTIGDFWEHTVVIELESEILHYIISAKDFLENWENTGVCNVSIIPNSPPEAPLIDGLTEGEAGVEYDYTFVADDPEEDDISYYVEWGDDTTSGWTEFVASGTEITLSHTWEEQGTYLIQAKAKDIHEAEGPWGELEVEMPLALQLVDHQLLMEQFLRYNLNLRL